MKPVIKLYVGLFTACCLLFTGSLYAAKVAQVEICHYDFDTSSYKLISMSTKGSDNHKLNHPDNHPGAAVPGNDGSIFGAECDVIESAPDVLLRAYIDVNRDNVYNADVDIPMVEVLDTNGVVGLQGTEPATVGDTVNFGQFALPEHMGDPCPIIEETGEVGDCVVEELVPAPDTIYEVTTVYRGAVCGPDEGRCDTGVRVEGSYGEGVSNLQAGVEFHFDRASSCYFIFVDRGFRDVFMTVFGPGYNLRCEAPADN